MANMEKIIELCESVLNKKIYTHREVCVSLCKHRDEKKEQKRSNNTTVLTIYIWNNTFLMKDQGIKLLPAKPSN